MNWRITWCLLKRQESESSVVQRTHPLLPIIRYRDVRRVVCRYLNDKHRSANLLDHAAEKFSQRAEDSATSPLAQDDAKSSIKVLEALERMSNQLAPYQFSKPPHDQPKLWLSDVEVSIYADLLVSELMSNLVFRD